MRFTQDLKGAPEHDDHGEIAENGEDWPFVVWKPNRVLPELPVYVSALRPEFLTV